MAQYAMITETGLNEVDNANTHGIYIELAYYLPVYDYRIDTTIDPTDTSISATEIATCTSSVDTIPQGEILWNLSGTDIYGLSPEKKYLVQTGSETVVVGGSETTITNFSHRNVFSINQFNGVSAISEHFTADTVESPGNVGTEWVLSNAGYDITVPPTSAEGYGPEDVDDPDLRFLYRGVSYQHVISSGDNSRGNFKVTMNINDGQFKFNKIGLYGVKRSADGVLIGDPFLFGQVIIPEPQILQGQNITNNNIGVTEFTIDFQIELATTSNGFENVIYSTSGDYWIRTTNEQDGNYGLMYDGSVYIINRLGVDEIGGVIAGDPDRSVAKLMAATFEYVNKPVISAERDMPQLCMQYVSSQGIESKRIRTTMRTMERGHCEVDMYGACLSGDDVRYSFIPKYDKELGLGLKDNRWGHLFLYDNFELFDDNMSAVNNDENFNGYYVRLDSSDTVADFYNTDVVVGPYHNSAMAAYYDDGDYYYTKRQKNYNYIRGNISSLRMTSTYETEQDVSPANYDLLVRGLFDIAMVTLNAKYENDTNLDAQSIITKMWNTIFRSDADYYELVKEKEDLQKSISRNRDSVEVAEWRKRIVEIDEIINSFDEDITGYLGEDKDILLFAGGKIRTYGNIEPARSGYHDLGQEKHYWNKLYTYAIRGSKGSDSGDRRTIDIDGDLVPRGEGRKIKANPSQGVFWKEINADRFGNSDEYIRKSYLTDIRTTNIEFGDDGIHLENHSMEGIINNIGTAEEPVDYIYVNNLIITSINKKYRLKIKRFNVPWGDLTFYEDWGKYRTQLNGMSWNTGELNLVYNSVTKKGTITTGPNTFNANFAQIISSITTFEKNVIYDVLKIPLYGGKGLSHVLGFDTLKVKKLKGEFQTKLNRKVSHSVWKQSGSSDTQNIKLTIEFRGSNNHVRQNEVLIHKPQVAGDNVLEFDVDGDIDLDLWEEVV